MLFGIFLLMLPRQCTLTTLERSRTALTSPNLEPSPGIQRAFPTLLRFLRCPNYQNKIRAQRKIGTEIFQALGRAAAASAI